MTQEVQPDVATVEQAESPLVELLQRPGCARMLDAFLSNRGLWLTEAHLEELAEVNQSTVNRNIDAFEEVSLVESRGSHPTQYRLNEEHPAVDPLLEAHRELYRDTARLADHNWAITVPTAESAKDEVQASLETLKIEFKVESASVRLDTTDRDEEQLLHDRSDEEAQLKEKLRELIENAQSRGDEEDPDKEPHHHDGEPGFRGVNSRSKMAAATAVRNHSTSQPA